ncbi:hypothetical protein [Carnobacterium pleistocenium]|uniref:hypothetical protein n=1 Tax=Carnobacterium pleistocenium TaxID=181073 RepID=UPI000551CDF8|nr:hypothetical protein [Carnobacterium pleistocenium]
MTTDIEWAELRTNVLENILVLMETWTGDPDEAVAIIAGNQPNLDQLKAIEQQLSEDAAFGYTPAETKLLTIIIPKQQQMMAAIRGEKLKLMDKMKQINQKNKVRDNYVSVKQEPVFVDRGI